MADAHIRALEYLDNKVESTIINLGTGDGYSVKEIIDEAKKVTGIYIKSEITGRRAGDPAVLIADNRKAKEILGWQPEYNLNKIIETAWKWHRFQKF